MTSTATFGADAHLVIIPIRHDHLGQRTPAIVEDMPFMKVTGGGGGTVRYTTPYASADKRLAVDVSAYDQLTLELINWPVDEYMHLIEGELEITDLTGNISNFGPGDTFVMPKGFSGTWRQLSPIKKFSVSYTPPE
ncbi:cupin domain-containing protein [Neorhizobium galegae]|uniref:Cupin domain-containing protein n=1 Tax=Neorhizobium galegae TaxID=399 RepID=A0A6A1TG24_NEOGA|nr:cupin domain-containing protein [Neorhizobium galegae]KAB1082191.1 cupin domain-containing protein [Neorhizobium galegae]